MPNLLPRVRPEPLPPGGRHLVMPGDTVYGLARRYAVPPAALIRMNALEEPYLIYVGQVLRLVDPPPAARPRPRHHVRPGETLAMIARRFDVGLGDLIALNRGIDPNRILPGQTLRLPAKTASTSRPPVFQAPVARPAAPALAEERRQMANAREAALREPPPRSGQGFLWPLDGEVLGRFGKGSDGRRNDGVNIAAAVGTIVRAAENGVVVYAGASVPAFGRMLLIRHADGYLTAYGHNADLLVGLGDAVQRGQPVARVGSTGHVRRPQLHFQLRRDTDALDPLEHMGPPGTRVASRG